MSKLDVKIVKLESMRVASILGFGNSPENKAWQQLEAWARPKGLLDDLERPPNRCSGLLDCLPNSPDNSYTRNTG